MQRERIKICVMRVGGTNRDSDAAECLEDQGAVVEVMHLNDLIRRRNLNLYDGLVLPGGFAYGDYVRAGAIWAKRIGASMQNDLERFADSGKPILGICNGFQVLVEAGLLPEPTFTETPSVALGSNESCRFECRWAYLKKNEESPCIFTQRLGQKRVRFPCAHGEGRFLVLDESVLGSLEKKNQIVLQYSKPSGELAEGSYPENPNGSVKDVAGICSPSGTIFGLMPHPENAYWDYQQPGWTKRKAGAEVPRLGDGFGIFKSMIDYIEQTF